MLPETRIEAPKELYTIPEVATILSLSERTVESLIANGYLRSAIAPGTERARRVSRAMLEEYVRDFNSQHPPGQRKLSAAYRR